MLYASHQPSASRSYVNLFCLNPKSGEMFLVKSIAKFSPEEFPQAYNRHKPVGLENTEMVFDGGSFKIKVDGEHELELADWRFETYQGKGVLHGILCAGKANAVTISAGLNASTIRFPSKRPIVSMTSHGEDIVIGYRGWSSDPRTRLRLLEAGKGKDGTRELLRHQIRFRPEEIRIDGQIGAGEGRKAIRITFTEEARYRAWKYWWSAQNHNERKAHQGDIGEAVACAFLEKSGYGVVERHTVKSKRFSSAHECRGLGRDILARKSPEYYVAEVKHWIAFANLAIREAERELVKFARSQERRNLEERLKARIKGAFAIQLDWSYERAEAGLTLVRLDFGDLAEGSGLHL